MSTLLFGKVVFSRRLDRRELADFGFLLVHIAAQERMGIQMSCNIIQSGVYETLNSPRVPSGEELPFILTNDPTTDVSDEIVDKYGPEYPVRELPNSLSERLQRVQKFVTQTMNSDVVKTMTIYISLGFGDEYEQVRVGPDEFASVAESYYVEVVDVPNVSFIVH